MLGVADEYVLARRVLLDALETLGPHREAIVLVGAQALYLHTGHVEFAVAPYTTDADLAVNPETLADGPLLAAVMLSGGFTADVEPGTCWKDAVQVDLMVPEALAGSGRRDARLGVHGNKVTRKARGLEAALVDCQVMKLAALADNDRRSFEIAIASPAALLVAKVHKIRDRIAAPNRLTDKDALDVYRLLSAVDAQAIAIGVEKLRYNDLSRAVTGDAFGIAATVRLSVERRDGARVTRRWHFDQFPNPDGLVRCACFGITERDSPMRHTVGAASEKADKKARERSSAYSLSKYGKRRAE